MPREAPDAERPMNQAEVCRTCSQIRFWIADEFMNTFVVCTIDGKVINISAEKFECETSLIYFYVGSKIVAVASAQNVSIVADSSMAKMPS